MNKLVIALLLALLASPAGAQGVSVSLAPPPDTRPAAGNITIIDSGTVTTTTGANGVNITTGTPTTGSAYTNIINGMSSVSCTVTGNWTGGTLTFESTADGLNYVANSLDQRGADPPQRSQTTQGNGVFQGIVANMQSFRVRATDIMTGTATVQCAYSQAVGPIRLQNAIDINSSALPSGAASDSNQSVEIAALNTLINNSVQACTVPPIASLSAGNNLVLKSSPGSLCSVYAQNLTSTAGFLVLLNAITAPADGAILPLACKALPANGYIDLNYGIAGAPTYGVGITAVLTSAATCFTKTTGTLTGFISGQVQ